MLERNPGDLGLEDPTAGCGLESPGGAMPATATTAPSSWEIAIATVAEETGRLLELDPAAAERALDALTLVRDSLAQALSERMAGQLSAALVRAADALPD